MIYSIMKAKFTLILVALKDKSNTLLNTPDILAAINKCDRSVCKQSLPRRIRNMQVIDTLGAAYASTQKSGSESQHLFYHMNSGKEYWTLFCNLI